MLTDGVEVGLRWVPTRTSQWIDLVGNGLGIAAGLSVGCGTNAVWRRFRGRALDQPDISVA